jgi:hypothetical protein
MIAREPARIYGLVSLNPYLSGSLLMPFSMSLALQIFVLFFLVLDLLGVFSCIIPVYLGCASCAFSEFPLLISKKGMDRIKTSKKYIYTGAYPR